VTADSVPHDPVPAAVAILRTSPLGHRRDDLAAASGDAVRLVELPFRAGVSLRLDPGGAAAARVGTALGGELPGPGAATDAGERSVLWLGPDEWLVTGPDDDAAAVVRLLTAALGEEHGSVVDVSAHRTTLELAGPSARAVLEKGVTLDLHPRVFRVGRVAATTLARAHVLLRQIGDEPTYHLLVRSSFAGYLADWLIDAVAEFTAGGPHSP
jgi:sarcosine oxidase subunit gamma